MKILDSIVGALRIRRQPRVRHSRGPVVSAGFGASGAATTLDQFEALRSSPDRSAITAANLSTLRQGANILSGSTSLSTRRESLASLARYVADNFGLAGYALELIANYSVPVWPQACSADPTWNRDAEQYFEDWCDRADYLRRFDFATLQRLICFAIDTDGDVGISMDLGHGYPQVRCWPCWRIGQVPGVPTPRMIEGVMIDQGDSVVGYQVVTAPSTYATLTADQLILLYEPTRFERYRGLSALRAGLNDIRDLSDIKGFLKLGTKVESALLAVIKGGQLEDSDWNDPANPSGSVGSATPGALSAAQLFGGEIPVIDGELQQLTSNTPGTNKLEFLQLLAGYFVAGLGLPPAFFNDEKLSGPNTRAVIGKAQRKFETRKATMGRFVKWSWVRVIAHGIETGALKPIENWQRCKIQAPPLLSIDLGDQASADADAFHNGRMSRQQYHGNQGKDWQDVEDQISRELNYVLPEVTRQSVAFGVPVEILLAARGFTVPKGMSPSGAELEEVENDDDEKDPGGETEDES